MNKTFIIITIVLLGICSSLVYYVKSSLPKTAYMDVKKVYNEFTLKKELESKLTNVEQTRKTILDSLELQLKVLSKQLEVLTKRDEQKENIFSAKREEYLVKKKQFDEDNQAMTQQYSEQIMKQLNQYVQDYGKTNGYTYIHGADGNGSMMYADDKHNITDEVTKFINEKYKGIK